jgi:hypothetical protein
MNHRNIQSKTGYKSFYLACQLLMFSAPTDNRICKITCFQSRVGLTNEHKGFILVKTPLSEVIVLRLVVFIDALGVTEKGVECSSSSHMNGVWISCRYKKDSGPFICGPEVP